MKSIPHSVLIIDASSEDRLELRRLLQGDPNTTYACLDATTAAEGLARCRERSPDAVLLNYQLPDDDGLAVLAALIAEHGPDTFALLLLSGAADRQLAVEAMKLGAHDCLVKSPQLDAQLGRAVAAAIEKAGLQRELARQRQALAASNAQLQQALATLADERLRQNVTLASIGDGLITTDTQGYVTFLNPEAERLTGWTSQDALGQPLAAVFRIVNEYTRAPVEDPAAKVLRTGTVVGLANHTMLIARDGRETPIDDSGAPIRQDDGTVVGVVLVFRDVTAHKQAELALRTSEQRFATAFRSSPIALAITRASDSHYIEVNQSFLDLHGYSQAEVIEHSALELNTFPNRDEIAAIGRAMRERQPVHNREITIRTKSGELRWVIFSSESIDMAGETCFLTTMFDSTERTRAEQAMERSAKRLQVLADASRAFAEVGADYHALLDHVAQTIADVLGEGCHIRLLSEDQQWLDLVALYDSDSEKRELTRTVLGDAPLRVDEPSLATQVFHSRQSLLLSIVDPEHARAATKPEYWSLVERLGIHSRILAPMRVQGQIFGIVGLYRYRPDQPPFNQDDLSLAQDLADRAALAIGNARLLQQLQAELVERTNAQAALRESEERLRAVTDTAQVGLVIVDQDHRYLYANPAYAAIFHLPSVEIVGQRVADVLAPVYQAQIRPRLERAFGGEWVNYELVVPPALADAEERHYTVAYQPGLYHSSTVVVVVVVDITERKLSEQRLRYQADLLSQVSDAIISTDAGFTIKSWNAAAETLYGWPTEQVIGRPMAEIVPTGYFHGNGQQSRASLFEHGFWQGEVIQQCRDGTQRSIFSSVRLIKDSAGTAAGAVAVNRDITERKRAELALERSNQRLRVLADASRAFAEVGTEYRALLDQIAQIAGEQLASGCLVRLISDDEQWLDLVALYYQDPALMKDAQTLPVPMRFHMDDSNPLVAVIRSGQPLLIPQVDPQAMRASMPEETWLVFQRFSPHSTIITLLQVQGRVIGCLIFSRFTPAQPSFTTDDLMMAQDLADRAALAIGNARLFGQVQAELAERMRTQVALRESEENLRVVTETAGIGLALVDADHRYRYMNQTFKNFLRLLTDELAGQRVADVLGPLYEQTVRRRLERAFAGESVSEYIDLPVAPGQARRCEARLQLGAYRTEPVVVVVLTDITERTRAESALQRYTDRLQHLRAIDQSILAGRSLAEIAEAAARHIEHLIPTTRLGVMLVDIAMERLSILTLRVRGSNHNPPSEVQASLALFGAAVDSLLHGQIYQVDDVAALPELPAFIRAGQAEEVRAYFHMPIMAQGELIALLNVGSDQPGAFTAEQIEIAREVADQLSVAIQQARLRTQVERYAQELEQRVADRTTALTAANKELEAFSYSISHDLRAPLRAIDGFSRILLEEYITSLPNEAQHYFQLVRGSAQQMGRLIDDLLAFARLSRQPLSKRSVEPVALVRECLHELQGEQAGRQVKITIGALSACQADPALLKQVWLNLLANALKYTSRRSLAEIMIASQAADGEIVYRVQDNGVGFDMRYSDKLFGVFQRLHRAEEYEGTGVGLAIVQRIIHRHGGRVWAEAVVDQGATFFFTLGSGETTE